MLADRIKRARKAMGLSLRDLAEKVALTHAAIKNIDEVVNRVRKEWKLGVESLPKLMAGYHLKIVEKIQREIITSI